MAFAMLAVATFTAGCSTGPGIVGDVPPQGGAFKGTTSAGKTVRLTLHADEPRLAATGEVGGSKVTFVETSWPRVAGRLFTAGAAHEPADMQVLPGNRLALRYRGEMLILQQEPAGVSPAAAAGPFAGVWEPSDALASPIAQMRLSQWDVLVRGQASVAGLPWSVLGAVGSPGSLAGSFVARDGSELRFSATLDPSGELVVSGLGTPVSLVKQ